MINEQIIIDTIKRMSDSGIDDATIVSTLKDIGLSEQDAVSMIAKVKAPAIQASAEAEETSEPQMEMMRNELETQAQKDELKDTTTYNMLNMHEQKIDEVSSKVDEMKQAITSAKSAAPDTSLALKVSEIETKVDEIDAQVKACLEVMKSILETDRKILVELEAKK
jgi:hypothetical protein